MNERILELWKQAGGHYDSGNQHNWPQYTIDNPEKFAELIVRECLDKIETHRIPVGNSTAGEMACEWTYSALMEIRDEILEHFGVEP